MTAAAAVEPLPEGTRVQVLAGNDTGEQWLSGTVVPTPEGWSRYENAVAVKIDPEEGWNFDDAREWDVVIGAGLGCSRLVRADEPVRRLRAVKL